MAASSSALSLPTPADFNVYIDTYHLDSAPENNTTLFGIEKGLRFFGSSVTSAIHPQPTMQRKIEKFEFFKEQFTLARTAEDWMNIAIALGKVGLTSQEKKSKFMSMSKQSEFCKKAQAMRALIIFKLTQHSESSTYQAYQTKITQHLSQITHLKTELITLREELLRIQGELLALSQQPIPQEEAQKGVHEKSLRDKQGDEKAKLLAIKHNEEEQARLLHELAHLGHEPSILQLIPYFKEIALEMPDPSRIPSRPQIAGVSQPAYPKLGIPLVYQQYYHQDHLSKYPYNLHHYQLSTGAPLATAPAASGNAPLDLNQSGTPAEETAASVAASSAPSGTTKPRKVR